MKKHNLLFWSAIFCLLFPCSRVYAQDVEMSLRLMTYNIQHGAGTDDIIDLDRQAAIINNALPDLVGMQEVDSCVKRSSYKPQAALLGSKTGMHATFGGAIPLTGGKYGVAILSKEAPLSHRNIPLPGNEKRTLLVCEFEEYVFATTHLDLDADARLASMDIIVEEAARWDKPFFICGDWNDEPTSTLITKMKRAGFRMLSYVSNTSAYYTFPASTPKKLIDYIASFGKVYNSVKSRKVLNEPEASDHRPVVVELTLDSYTTDIRSATAGNDPEQPEAIYDLTGRQIANSMLANKLTKGIFIRNGKKFVVK